MHNPISFFNKLRGIEQYQVHYRELLLRSVRSSFPQLIYEQNRTDLDLNYLISCASVLAQSADGISQDEALRIAHFTLTQTDTTDEQRAASMVVLDTLSNNPALELALRKRIAPSNYFEKIPLPIQLDSIQRRIKHGIVESNGNLQFLNRFQSEVYQGSKDAQWLSIAAPTSSGKSYILIRIIAEFLSVSDAAVVVFIVPTRALVFQIEEEFRNAMSHIQNLYLASVPILDQAWRQKRCLFVFTQERLQWLLSDNQDLSIDMLVIDEAQKIGGDHRGILLEQVIKESARVSPRLKVLFSSPNASNPQVLLRDKPKDASGLSVKSSSPAVNQNLIWTTTVKGKPRIWAVDLIFGNETFTLGNLPLSKSASKESERLPLIAHGLGHPEGGNLVYVNGPAEGERTAEIIWDLLGEQSSSSDPELVELIDLVGRVIHKKYVLTKVLDRGVAFHYGNLPLLIRLEIERLYKQGKIRYLICTSTLLEGVNLPAKSIFIRNPCKGHGTPMNDFDFWNLAGRAGRAGKEFQGNVICVDPNDGKTWKMPPPRFKREMDINRASDLSYDTALSLLEYIEARTPRKEAVRKQYLEYLFTYFLQQFAQSGSLHIPTLNRDEHPSLIAALEDELRKVLDDQDIKLDLIKRNPGISPFAMKELLRIFREFDGDPNELIPANPNGTDAIREYQKLILRISDCLSGDTPEILAFYRAKLVVNWMSGKPLAMIIGSNESYWKKRPEKRKTLEQIIRSTLDDVEQFVRFSFARYSSCYLDVLRQHFEEIGRTDAVWKFPKLHLWLEFGASSNTQLSLISLGLSRGTAIDIAERTRDDNYDITQAREWLKNYTPGESDFPRAVFEEILRIKSRL